VTVWAVTVAGSTEAENVAWTVVPTATWVAPSAGETPVTVGAVAVVVEKPQLSAAAIGVSYTRMRPLTPNVCTPMTAIAISAK